MIGDKRLSIFLTSFLILFLELALIRYLPSQVYYLGFYANFILIGAFVGMGGGILLAKKKRDLVWFFPWLLLTVVGLSALLTVSVVPDQRGEIHFTSSTTGIPVKSLPEIVAVPAIFILVTLVFLFLSQRLGRLLDTLKPLTAYTWDIAGSLTGIAVFTVSNFLELNPLVWFVFFSALFLLVVFERSWRWMVSAIVLALVVVIVAGAVKGSLWSPYQKVTLGSAFLYGDPTRGIYGTDLFVNNILHQTMVFDPQNIHEFYSSPYGSFRSAKYKEALIIGAGSGNDLALALKNGVEHVDAVEIDPVIYQIGRELNPNRPYQDPRVSIHIDDGRSFLEKHKGGYDLIVFALPDSLVLASGNSAIRLESFLFTREAIQAAKNHLNPGGLLVLYNFYRKEWLLGKITQTVDGVFGRPSYVKTGGASDDYLAAIMNGDKLSDLKSFSRVPFSASTASLESASDDWPFLYLFSRSIPGNYILMLAVIGVFTYLLLTAVTGVNLVKEIEPTYFFLGMAFLLLETRSIIQFSLLFGNTWVVNAFVFFGILVLVLLAIRISLKVGSVDVRFWYVALGVALLFQYFFPTSALLGYAPEIKYVAITLITLIPVFFANIIFSLTFKESKNNSFNFASNILGAAVGGISEYLALVLGYKNLIPIIFLCYVLALVLPKMRKRKLAFLG